MTVITDNVLVLIVRNIKITIFRNSCRHQCLLCTRKGYVTGMGIVVYSWIQNLFSVINNTIAQ